MHGLKQIGTICFAIFAFIFTAPLFAIISCDPSLNGDCPDCINSNLQTYSGTSNLQANWQANTIDLHWYNNNTLMENVADVSSDCTYDSTLTPPSTIPTRTGYTFTGWKVRPTMDFSTIPTSANGTERWAIGFHNDADYCWYNIGLGSSQNVNCDSDTTYSKEIQRYEWKVKFGHGDVYGMAGCSTMTGTHGVAGNPSIGSGQYCWCKATGYKATNASEINGPLGTLSWVYSRDASTTCARSCAYYCALNVLGDSAFREELFGVSQYK